MNQSTTSGKNANGKNASAKNKKADNKPSSAAKKQARLASTNADAHDVDAHHAASSKTEIDSAPMMAAEFEAQPEAGESDSDSLVPRVKAKAEMEMLVESPEQEALSEVGEPEQPAQITQMVEPLVQEPQAFEEEKGNAEKPGDESAETQSEAPEDETLERTMSGDVSTEISQPAEQVEPSDSASVPAEITLANETAQDAGVPVAAAPKSKRRGAGRLLSQMSPRYTAACREVSRLRQEFLDALDEKAQLLGVERVGEAVPLRSMAMESINREIRETREKLEKLVAHKKRLKGDNPEVDTINARIRELNRQRQTARLEKKAAYEEATEAQSLVKRDPLATS